MNARQLLVLSPILILVCASSVLAQNAIHHTGDIVIMGDEVLTIADTMYYQRGNVSITGKGQLILRNATLYVEQEYYQQYVVVVQDEGRLVADSSRIDSNYRIAVQIFGRAEATLTDFTTGWLVPGGDAAVRCENVHLLNELIVFDNPRVQMSNSTIAALDVFLSGKTPATLQNMWPGRWSSVDFGAMFETGEHPALTFENTEVGCVVLPVPYPGATLTCLDCQLGVTILTEAPSTLVLDSLSRGQCTDLSVGDVRLVRCLVEFWMVHPNATHAELQVNACSDLMMGFTDGNTDAVISDSTVNLCALSYHGKIEFQNATLQGEMVFENSRFEMSGGVRFAAGVEFITWYNTTVERSYDVAARNRQGLPTPGVEITLTQGGGEPLASATTDRDGRAALKISFSDRNRSAAWRLKASYPDRTSVTRTITFLTPSPIVVVAS
jgi:hypothetical protein